MSTYSVDGVPLDHAAGCWSLLIGTGRRPLPAIRNSVVKLTGISGELPIVGEDFDTTVLGLTMMVYGVTEDGNPGDEEDLESNLEALTGLLGVNHRNVVLRHTIGALTREAEVRFVAGSEPELLHGANAYRLTTLARIPGVFWRSPDTYTWTAALTSSSAPKSVTDLAGSTGPITDAIIRVTGPADNVVITDVTTGGVLSCPEVISGRHLLVDCGQMRAAIVTTDTFDLDAGTDVTGDVDSSGPGSSTRWLHLTPSMSGTDPHTRLVRITATAIGTDEHTLIKVRARRSYK